MYPGYPARGVGSIGLVSGLKYPDMSEEGLRPLDDYVYVLRGRDTKEVGRTSSKEFT